MLSWDAQSSNFESLNTSEAQQDGDCRRFQVRDSHNTQKPYFCRSVEAQAKEKAHQ